MWDGPHLAGEAARPVLLMAHGMGGLPEKFDAFATSIAGEGFLVAALRFPLSSSDSPGGGNGGPTDLGNQPGDLSHVLEYLEFAAVDPNHQLFGKYDLERVTVLGHSLGGGTVLGLTRYDRCLDARADAVIYVAAATLYNDVAFRQAAVNSAGPPALLIHGLDDETIA